MIQKLVEHLDKHPDITYQAVNIKNEEKSNVADDDVNAVTWGVFRGKEIIQPTVVDHQAFKIWKVEAFNTWIQTWSIVYNAEKTEKEDKPADQESIDFLKSCHDNMWLMNIVDNDYVESKLTLILNAFIDDNQDLIQGI